MDLVINKDLTIPGEQLQFSYVRSGGPGGSRTVLVCPHCNHRLVVVLAPEQGGGRNGGGPGRRPNNGR